MTRLIIYVWMLVIAGAAHAAVWQQICQIVWPKTAACEQVAQAVGQASVCPQIYLEDAEVGDRYLFVSERGNTYDTRIRKNDLRETNVPVDVIYTSKYQMTPGEITATRINFSSLKRNGIMRAGDYVSFTTMEGINYEGWVKGWGIDSNSSFIGFVNSKLEVQHFYIADINFSTLHRLPRRTRGPPTPPDAESQQRLELLANLPPPTYVTTRREAELPYRQPRDMRIFNERSKLDPRSLERDTTYLFTIDANGNLRMAKESNPEYKRKLKHGDLEPATLRAGATVPENTGGAPGDYRGSARFGGDLRVSQNANGELEVFINSNSSYTFARFDSLYGNTPQFQKILLDLLRLYTKKDARIYFSKTLD